LCNNSLLGASGQAKKLLPKPGPQNDDDDEREPCRGAKKNLLLFFSFQSRGALYGVCNVLPPFRKKIPYLNSDLNLV